MSRENKEKLKWFGIYIYIYIYTNTLLVRRVIIVNLSRYVLCFQKSV